MSERGSVFLASVLVVAMTAAGWAQESSRRNAGVGAAAGFEHLKALAGRWHGVDAEGRGVDVSVEVVSGALAIARHCVSRAWVRRTRTAAWSTSALGYPHPRGPVAQLVRAADS